MKNPKILIFTCRKSRKIVKNVHNIEIIQKIDNYRKFSPQDSAIPDARLIHMARKQRQLARDAGEFASPASAAGGIAGEVAAPLDDTQRYRAAQRSRLVREDDENDKSASENDEEDEQREGNCETGGRFYSRQRNRNDDARRRAESEFLNTEQGNDMLRK